MSGERGAQAGVLPEAQCGPASSDAFWKITNNLSFLYGDDDDVFHVRPQTILLVISS